MTRNVEIVSASLYSEASKYGERAIKGFIEGAKWADKHPGWISVKDEMPEEDCDVLVFNEDQIMFIANHSHDYWWSNDECVNCDNIAYWMELPSDPKEGGSNAD
jgi:hypothetical protein